MVEKLMDRFRHLNDQMKTPVTIIFWILDIIFLIKQNDVVLTDEQFQAEKLKEAESFRNLMMQYRCAIMEVETKLKVLNEEFSRVYKRNPFESIKSRLKTPESLYERNPWRLCGTVPPPCGMSCLPIKKRES